MKLSIVIPAYNEQHRIGPTLDTMAAYLNGKDYETEVIVVDDGSADSTQQEVRNRMETFPNLRLLDNGANHGKGYSVRHGVTEARGEYVLFFDADSSTPIDQIENFWPRFDQGYDICIGSRSLPDSDVVVRQPWLREIMGRVFRVLVRLLAIGDFSDTQCGFKAFSASSAKVVFKRQTLEGFGFDVELLYVAKKFGFRIAEVAVKWIDSPESKLHPGIDAMKMFLELISIRFKNVMGKYQ